MKLSLACLCSIFAIIKSFNLNAIFAIDLGFAICHNLFLTYLACYLHNSTLEMFLVVGFRWVHPIIALVTVYFSYHFNHEWVVWRVVRNRRRLHWWWWRNVVIRRRR